MTTRLPLLRPRRTFNDPVLACEVASMHIKLDGIAIAEPKKASELRDTLILVLSDSGYDADGIPLAATAGR